VVHALQLTGAGWLGTLIGFHPFVASVWGSDLFLESRRSGFRRYLLKKVLKKADGITVYDEVMKQGLLILGTREEKIRLLPWGIDTEIFNPAPDDREQSRSEFGFPVEAQLLLCPRRPAPLYRQDLIIAAVADLLNEFPELHLALLQFRTDETWLARLKAQIRELNLTERVHFLPAQANPDAMARFYRMSDIVVSIPESDGYANSVKEALACARPVVVSDLPSFGNFTDGEILYKVSPGNSDQLTDVIRKLLADQKILSSLSSNAAEYAGQLSENAKTWVDRQSKLYEELCR